MSVESCTAFLEQVRSDPTMGERMRAVTDTHELIALGQRHGYAFEVEDLVAAAAALPEQDETAPLPSAEAEPAEEDEQTAVLHYELNLQTVPELHPVLEELPHLTIEPDSVDLEGFHAAQRDDDLEWTDMSPAAPGFRERYEEIMDPHWSGAETAASRRDFHLVNLDQHVDHALYEGYFDAKVRIVRHLSQAFDCDIRFSGSMWYPPFSYRLWHTNESQPGWRMYLVDLDEPVAATDMRTFFRYMNPQTKELVTLQDRPKMLRFFKVEQGESKLFWHCIVNGAPRNRWSFGFAVPDDWMARLQSAAPAAAIEIHPTLRSSP
ncbi:MAG: Nif11-like leader peptide family natural product precursor [Solirubrobacterales bacterium]